MPRSKQYTIVRVVEGKLEVSTYESDAAARDALAHLDAEPGIAASEPLVFIGEPVPFAIDRKPTVTLGEPRGRKPRAKKDGAAPRARKTRSTTTVDESVLTGAANGAQTKPAEAPAAQEG